MVGPVPAGGEAVGAAAADAHAGRAGAVGPAGQPLRHQGAHQPYICSLQYHSALLEIPCPCPKEVFPSQQFLPPVVVGSASLLAAPACLRLAGRAALCLGACFGRAGNKC